MVAEERYHRYPRADFEGDILAKLAKQIGELGRCQARKSLN